MSFSELYSMSYHGLKLVSPDSTDKIHIFLRYVFSRDDYLSYNSELSERL